MITPMHYNFKDVLWAPARGLSAKKILVMTLFLLIALAVYDLFTYIALALQGENLGTVYNAYGLLPFYKLVYSNIFAQIVFGIGLVFTVLSVMLGFFAVSAIEIEAIRGNRFFSPIEAVKFSVQRLKQIFLAEIAIISFILFVTLLFALLGLISRIPFIGEWLYSILFLIPNFLIALFTIFIFFILQISIILLPSTAAAEHKGEAFQAILETFATIIRQPLRWLGYTIYALVSGKICSFIYAYFCYRAVEFMTFASAFGGGDKIKELVKAGLSHLPLNSDVAYHALNIFPRVDFGLSLRQFTVPSSSDPASYIMAVMLFIIFTTVAAYFLSTIATAQARGYAVIRYLKDNYKIEDERPMGYIPDEDEGE